MPPEKDTIIKLLDQIKDPEIPILSIAEMGMLRDVSIEDDGKVKVFMTPTYSGCPATDLINVDIITLLQENGYDNVKIIEVLSPPWTTDWLSDEAKSKMIATGIAPPLERSSDKGFLLGESPKVNCPYCKSTDTKLLSLYGTTACKSLYTCSDCLQPFDHFKCH